METKTGTAQGAVDGYLMADFPWYGLDEAFTGRRWLGAVGVSADGTGHLEATSVASAAWLAGSVLLSCTWPTHMERSLRQDWMDQQTAAAWELADDLAGSSWSTLTLPVDGEPTPFHYRESEYGWVMAGAARGAHLGAYGRGMSAYGLALSVVRDLATYQR